MKAKDELSKRTSQEGSKMFGTGGGVISGDVLNGGGNRFAADDQ